MIGNKVPTLTDIWEYDPITNNWLQKANFPASPRYGAAGFSIEKKGYISCGNEGSATGPYSNDLWEFDPSINTWIQKADFPGTPRYGLTHMGLCIGNKGYLGFGLDGPNSWPSDFYEYDPSNNSWTKKANFPMTGRSYGVAFSSCYKYFAGTGQNGSALSDIWQYDPGNDTWSQKANFGGGNRWLVTCFVINGQAYVGTGYDFTNNYSDWWKYKCDTEGIFENNNSGNFSSLYPNVFTNHTVLDISQEINVTHAEMRVFDFAGKLLRAEKLNNNITKIERAGLLPGTYIYEVLNDEKKVGFGKFIIN